MDISRPLKFFENHRFSVVSWSATGLLVVALLGSTVWWKQNGSSPSSQQPEPTAAPNQQQAVALPSTLGSLISAPSIGRALQLKTSITGQGSLQPITYKVERGDSVFGIAKQYNIKPESILYSNESTLNDNPTNLTPGMVLTIPPVDGLLYTWQKDDTIQKVADEFKADLNGDKKVDQKDAALLA